MSLWTAVTAAGTTQADATPVKKIWNNVATVPTNSGVILPVGESAGTVIYIKNAGANALKIYPHKGGNIDGGTTDASISLGTGTTYRLVTDGRDNWFRY